MSRIDTIGAGSRRLVKPLLALGAAALLLGGCHYYAYDDPYYGYYGDPYYTAPSATVVIGPGYYHRPYRRRYWRRHRHWR